MCKHTERFLRGHSGSRFDEVGALQNRKAHRHFETMTLSHVDIIWCCCFVAGELLHHSAGVCAVSAAHACVDCQATARQVAL